MTTHEKKVQCEPQRNSYRQKPKPDAKQTDAEAHCQTCRWRHAPSINVEHVKQINVVRGPGDSVEFAGNRHAKHVGRELPEPALNYQNENHQPEDVAQQESDGDDGITIHITHSQIFTVLSALAAA